MLKQEQLHLLLTQKYKCTDMGKPLAPPYCDADDLPTFFKTPSGLQFAVSPPHDGVGYPKAIVDKIIEAAKLNVVVNIEPKEASNDTGE